MSCRVANSRLRKQSLDVSFNNCYSVDDCNGGIPREILGFRLLWITKTSHRCIRPIGLSIETEGETVGLQRLGGAGGGAGGPLPHLPLLEVGHPTPPPPFR